jgi:hypothetical protein
MKLNHQLLDQEPAITEFQIPAFEDLFGQPLAGATHWADLKWFRPVSVTGGKMSMLIVPIDDIYKMILEDSVLDRSLTRRDTKSGLLVVPKTHVCCGKYQVGNIYSLGGYIHGIMDGNLADSGLIQDVGQIALM